jgi:VWFA-related protein
VLVTDKQGNPITGLEEKDFTLLDNGQPRPLLSFSAVDPRTDPGAVQVIIAVDMINTGFDQIAYEREQLGEFLNQDGGKLAYPTRLAVLTEHGVKMMPGTSTDGHAILAEFVKVQTDMRMIGRSAGFYGATERVEYSLTALGQLVDSVSTQPGHKVMILLSPGWPLLAMAGVQETAKQRDWVFNTLTQWTDELQKAQVSLYSVDPNFLGRTDPFFYRAFLKPVRRPDQGEFPVLSLQVLAEHSGGRALTMGHDVRGQLNAAMRDAGPYYRITFETQPPDKPNEYHDLQVKVDRPEAVTRTAAGYYARIEPVGGKTVSPAHPTKPF